LLQHSGKYLPQDQIYSAPPDPLAGFKGPTSKGREEKEWRVREERAERGGEAGGGERSGSSKFAITPLVVFACRGNARRPRYKLSINARRVLVFWVRALLVGQTSV